ncbi:MAG TPA: amidase, partial [Candidatus Angelobacter sp.]|nr:amidase [Candidatus Angelobacter sp.]
MKTIKAIFVIIATALPILTAQADPPGVPTRHNEATIAQLQREMARGDLTSVQLTNYYLARIRAL